MRNSIAMAFLILFIIHSPVIAQKSDIKMAADPNPWHSPELSQLAQWQGIAYHKVNFTGKDLDKKNYSITAKEIWDGVITKTEKLYDSATVFGPLSGNSLEFSIMASKQSDDALKMKISFDKFSVDADYKATESNDYYLSILEAPTPIEKGKPFYAFAYILPYEIAPGYQSYCPVKGTEKEIESWGKQFGIKHYILYELNFY